MSNGSIYPNTPRCRSKGCDWVVYKDGLCAFHWTNPYFVKGGEI